MSHESYGLITEQEISYEFSPAASVLVMRCLMNTYAEAS